MLLVMRLALLLYSNVGWDNYGDGVGLSVRSNSGFGGLTDLVTYVSYDTPWNCTTLQGRSAM